MVGISVQEFSSGVSTMRIILIFSAAGAQKRLVEHRTFPILKSGYRPVNKIAGNNYLVKKIPNAIIAQRAYPMVKNIPERIINP